MGRGRHEARMCRYGAAETRPYTWHGSRLHTRCWREGRGAAGTVEVEARTLSASTPPSMSVNSLAMSFIFFTSLATRFFSSAFSASVDRWLTRMKVPEMPNPIPSFVGPLILTGCGGVGATALRAANAGGARIITLATPIASAVPTLSRLRLRMLRCAFVGVTGPGCSSARMTSAGRLIETAA